MAKERKCIDCGASFVWERKPGMSPRRCAECHAMRKQTRSGTGNMTHRPMGHRTRQQHKRVPY